MAVTGTQADLAARLRSILPPSWFSNPAPNLSALLQAPANVFSQLYSLIVFAKAQTRIATASGIFLDLIAFDFFGRAYQRKPAQGDISWRAAIKARLLRPRQTRAAILNAVETLTDAGVTAFEAWNASDTGGFGACWAFGEPTCAWGSTSYPYQVFINAAEPLGSGVPNISGFSNSYSGFGAGYFYFADLSSVPGAVANQDIYDEINATKAAGTIAWVNISNPPPSGARLDMDFVLDSSVLTDLPQDMTATTTPVTGPLGTVLVNLLGGENQDLGLVTQTPPSEYDDLGAATSGPIAIIDLGTA